MGKPKKTKAMKLEDKSLHRLKNFFETDNFQIREENKRDAGIDLTIEITDDEFTNWRFNVQLKAKEKAGANKTGIISRKIKTSNLRYMRSGPLLGLYILWVKETDIFYYQWVDEFFDALEENVPEWWTQKNNTLHFRKQLDWSEVTKISERVKRHAIIHEQLRAGKKIEHVFESFHDPKKTELYDDVENSLVKLIDLFEGLSVIRPDFIVKFPPFARSKDSKTSFNRVGRTIETDNPAVLTFFNNLELVDNTITSRTTGQPLDKGNITKILRFLEWNLVHHIEPIKHNSPERVCIHDLYIRYDTCNCEKCSYGRLQWNNVVTKIDTEFDKEDAYNWLRRGYMLLELGKVREAYQLYRDLATYSKRQKRVATYIISRYCLISMLFFVKHRYSGKDRHSMIEEIQGIDVRNEIYFMAAEGKMTQELVYILLTLLDGQYSLELYVDIDLEYQKIISVYNVDQQGRTVYADHYQEIVSPVTELTVFAEGNGFHGQFFNGLGVMVQKMLESAIILHSLQNPLSKKLSFFDNYLVHLLFRYGTAEDFNKMLYRHDVKSIVFGARHSEGDKKLEDLFDNFFSSFSEAETFAIKESNNDNSIPNVILDQQIRKVAILISMMEVPDDILNRHTRSLINLIKRKKSQLSEALGGFRDILRRRRAHIDRDTLMDIYKWLILLGDQDNSMLLLDIPSIVRKNFPDFTDADAETQKAITNRLSQSESRHRSDNELLLAYWQIASIEIKEQIRMYLRHLLQKSFDGNLYYQACLQGIIDVSEFFDNFKAKISMTPVSKKIRIAIQGYEDFRNTRLTQLIHLGFKFNIDLKDPSIQAHHQDVDYYIWLLNLDTFDYSKFNPYWVLFEPIDDFFNEFKKHRLIRKHLKAFLVSNRSPRLAEYYIQYFDQ